jgi:hypothetical protein
MDGTERERYTVGRRNSDREGEEGEEGETGWRDRGRGDKETEGKA